MSSDVKTTCCLIVSKTKFAALNFMYFKIMVVGVSFFFLFLCLKNKCITLLGLCSLLRVSAPNCSVSMEIAGTCGNIVSHLLRSVYLLCTRTMVCAFIQMLFYLCPLDLSHFFTNNNLFCLYYTFYNLLFCNIVPFMCVCAIF